MNTKKCLPLLPGTPVVNPSEVTDMSTQILNRQVPGNDQNAHILHTPAEAQEKVLIDDVISSWVGVTFVFIFATRKVFQNNSRISLKWKYLIYLAYQAVLIWLISKLLGQIDLFIRANIDIALAQRFSAIIAKIVVTPITMILNFIVMKNVIERI